MNAAGPSCKRSFSPHKYWAQVPDRWVQTQLRRAFQQWGLPRRIRIDNGQPWGSWSDLPPVLALWLIGLGIELVWIPVRQPQCNGVVERSQGTGKRWGDPQRCDNAAQLQRALDEADRLQRDLYPYVGEQARVQVWPSLRHSGRPYESRQEPRHWQLERVLDHLAGYAVTRRVDRTGLVSVYDRSYYVGVLHRGQEVYVQLDPQKREWLFSDSRGQCLRSQPAVGMDAKTIRTLQLPGPKRKRR
jgi:hypothetical protein